MDNGFSREPMLDIFIYETMQNIEQLEASILAGEKAGHLTPDTINEVFRVMHTIKGSAAMMMCDNIASLAHALEDLFSYIREDQPENMDCGQLFDLVLESADFIKLEMEKVKGGQELDGDPAGLIAGTKECLRTLKGVEADAGTLETEGTAPLAQHYYLPAQKSGEVDDRKTYEAVIFFEDGCEMENIRAFVIIHRLKDITTDFSHIPVDIVDDAQSVDLIREQGFTIYFKAAKNYEEMYDFFMGTAFVRDLTLREVPDEGLPEDFSLPGKLTLDESPLKVPSLLEKDSGAPKQLDIGGFQQSIISVDVVKLDKLMDLMGELVIAEAMVTQNPELKALKLDSFERAARQLKKITGEMQDTVMSIRMVPLSASFRKMHRVVRDVSKKLGKEVDLALIGEGTEVDKNIIEHISDPLMHLVRNAVGHGIETPAERLTAGKPQRGQVVLEAKGAGSDVLIIVRDDGRGIVKDEVLQRAMERQLLDKPAGDLTDEEIYNLIFQPGFSTNEVVDEFSGRGVGLDVVTKNLEAIGGSVSVASKEGAGTVTTLKIPLTLAIIDAMNIRVGAARYTLPTTSIKETFQAKAPDLIRDPEGEEMIMVRGEVYSVLRLHQVFAVQSDYTDLTEGIMLMIEEDGKFRCLFADELLGQQQVVVKALPSYMKSINKVQGLAGCTLLGDGGISLILNVGGLLGM